VKLVWLLLLTLGLGGGYWAWGAFEGDPPRIATLESLTYVGAPHEHEFTVVDDGRGVESVRVFVVAGEREYKLFSTTYEGTWHSGAELKMPRRIQTTVSPKDLELPQGAATLVAEATDFSWRRNQVRVEVPLMVDARKPRLSVLTGLTYIRQGGTELAVYEIDEPTSKHGVEVGEGFFPGFAHPKDPKLRIALYAIPHDAPKGQAVELIAIDRAGNRTEVPLSISVLERRQTADRLTLDDNFLRAKVDEILNGDAPDPLTGYLKINREVRAENDKKLRELCAESSGERLWDSAFTQMPSSKVGAGFAEARTYVYNGKDVDRQLHLGFDLSSTARSEVPAANDGVVVFADELGIYGRVVVIDHGLGLFSLYGHLSEIAVERGKAVAQGQTLGRTGTTGLAGGDHLHYAMLLSGTFIDPLEWFDRRWIQEHIEAKLAPPPPEVEEPGAPPATGAGG
jgi:murein DD-endopeptidase MepM/ murein hydrolase activator NlpD